MPNTRAADGTRTLTFAYTVRELDRSHGIAVDRVELNGGAISSWAHPGAAATNPNLSQVRLGHDANHQVDGRLPPSFESAAVDGTALTVTFHEDLDTASVPAPGAFHVTVNNARRNVASGGVAISGATVTLTLASAVTRSDTVKVRYTKPSARPLQGAAGLRRGHLRRPGGDQQLAHLGSWSQRRRCSRSSLERSHVLGCVSNDIPTGSDAGYRDSQQLGLTFEHRR